MQQRTELTARASAPILSYSTPSAPAPAQEMTLPELWALLVRRRMIILYVFLAVVALAALVCATSTKMYKATGEIQVQKEAADAVGLQSLLNGDSGGAADAVETNMTMQTEAQILQSDSIALSVVKKLNLEHSPDFKSPFNPIGWVIGLLSPKGIEDPKDVPLEDAPGRRSHAIKAFEAHLKVKPISGTRLITIDYLSSDPKTAAAVVNLLISDLVDYNFATRHDATNQVSTWLSSQLTDLRKRSEDLQAQLINLQRGSGVFSTGQTDAQGHEQVYTPALDRLQQATSQLAQAQSSRIMKGALYQVVKDGDPELISGLAGSTLGGASSGISGSLTLLQNLREQEAQTESQLSELTSKFGPNYPKIDDVKATLATQRQAIRDESGRIAARVKNDYEVAQQVEDNDRAVFNQIKSQAEATNDKAVSYEIVQQEATQSRNLYESLLGRLKEADLVAGMHSSNITLVDPARATARPSKPNVLIFAAGGLVGGLVLGVCAALFRDATDNRIQDYAELDALASDAPIAFLPYHSSTRKRLMRPKRGAAAYRLSEPANGPSASTFPEAMVAAAAPRSAYTEALRTLRTSLMQSSHGGPPPQLVLVTSSIPGEGKSMLCMNLAIVYAQRGKKVLLVDGDLRTPMLHTRLGLVPHQGIQGLTDLLSANGAGAGFRPERVSLGGTLGLDVIPAGPASLYPAELLASDEMAELVRQWRADYDFIFIDGAPLLPVTDSAVLGRYADFTLIVARHNMTDRRSLERTCQLLRAQGVHNTGVVLNGVRMSGGAQYRYYGYTPTAYDGGATHA